MSVASHGALLVDKPSGPTSHDVVAWARKALGTRAVGHTGTLDPMATGVLLLVCGEATKLVPYLTADDKAYYAVIRLGVETDTLDAHGVEVARAPVPDPLTGHDVERAAQALLGEQWQTPPLVSAIKMGGEALYAKARRGEQVEVPPRRVVLRSLKVLKAEGQTLEIELTCSKGYYVRSLARDLAARLDTRGHLVGLRRLRQGPFALEECFEGRLLQVAAAGDAEARQQVRAAMLDLSEVCRGLPRRVLGPQGCQAAAHGQPLGPDALVDGVLPQIDSGPVALFDEAGILRAMALPEVGRLRVVRGFRYG